MLTNMGLLHVLHLQSAKALMEEEMKTAVDAKRAQEAAGMAAAEKLREKQRAAIATPGSSRPATGSRRKFGL
jgi:hypothetical protein